MSNILKPVALYSLRASGIFSLSTRLRRRNTLVILCYHGISIRDEHQWAGGLYMTPALFRERLDFLRSWGANVLPLAEGLKRLETGTLPPRSVVLTFDDGFHDFHRYAFPALREFGYPCTLYLTTYYCRYRLPIFNLTINYLLWKSRDPVYATLKAREQAVTRYRERAAADKLDTPALDLIARRLAENIGVDYDAILRDRLFQIMAPDEVAAVAEAGIDIQLHTHRHRTPADRELFIREIRDNSRIIEEITGRVPQHFCYPSGVTSPVFPPWLRECGVESATTCESGMAERRSDPLMLPRYLDGSGVEWIDFESWLSGIR